MIELYEMLVELQAQGKDVSTWDLQPLREELERLIQVRPTELTLDEIESTREKNLKDGNFIGFQPILP